MHARIDHLLNLRDGEPVGMSKRSGEFVTLDDLLRTRERLAATLHGIDEWARADVHAVALGELDGEPSGAEREVFERELAMAVRRILRNCSGARNTRSARTSARSNASARGPSARKPVTPSSIVSTSPPVAVAIGRLP